MSIQHLHWLLILRVLILTHVWLHVLLLLVNLKNFVTSHFAYHSWVHRASMVSKNSSLNLVGGKVVGLRKVSIRVWILRVIFVKKFIVRSNHNRSFFICHNPVFIGKDWQHEVAFHLLVRINRRFLRLIVIVVFVIASLMLVDHCHWGTLGQLLR